MIPDLCQFSVSDKLAKVLIYLTLANSRETMENIFGPGIGYQ